MNTEESIERIKRKITIGECEKNIGIPVYISDLKVVLSELEKKDKVINEIEDLCIRKSDDEGEEYGGVIIWNFAHKIMEIINKVEREGK